MPCNCNPPSGAVGIRSTSSCIEKAPSPQTLLDSVISDLYNISSRLAGTTTVARENADRLLGPSPLACGSGTDEKGPSGTVYSITLVVSTIHNQISTLQDEVSRLNNV